MSDCWEKQYDGFLEDYIEAMAKAFDENLKEWLQKQGYGVFYEVG